MVTLGTDSHKATHTFVAADEAGRQLGQSTFGANGDGHLKALKWAGQWSERRWRWRTAGTCHVAWSATCSAPGRGW